MAQVNLPAATPTATPTATAGGLKPGAAHATDDAAEAGGELALFADALGALLAELLGGKPLPPPAAAAADAAPTLPEPATSRAAASAPVPTQLLAQQAGRALLAVVQAQGQGTAVPPGTGGAPTGDPLAQAGPVATAAAPALTPVPVQAGAPSLALPVPMGQPQWAQGMGERVVWMVNQSIPQATVRLNPAELGPVEIRLSVQQDQASVSFIATHATTREALEAAIPRLREMLGEQGIALGEVNVSDRAPQEEHAPGGRGAELAGGGNGPEEQDEAPAAAHWTASGRLDLYA